MVVKKIKIIETYERDFLEVHEEGHDGKWRRVASSPSLAENSEAECLNEVLKSVGIIKGGLDKLEGFLPSDLCRIGKLRLCKVKRHVEVSDFDVKLALRRISRR